MVVGRWVVRLVVHLVVRLVVYWVVRWVVPWVMGGMSWLFLFGMSDLTITLLLEASVFLPYSAWMPLTSSALRLRFDS